MTVPVPNLDDRSFAELMESARARIRQVDPEWTDLSVHDPGIVLVEAFAHLTDMLLYRLNRLPDRLYATYVNLLGTSVTPPDAASTELVFSRVAPTGPEIRIPRGTQVGIALGVPGEPQPVFATTADAVLVADAASVTVSAMDASRLDAVSIGTGTGRPGQVFTVPNTPIVGNATLSIAIEVVAGQQAPSGSAVLVDGTAYRYCREVEAFVDAEPGEPVVRVDRTSGTVSFAWWSDDDPTPPVVPAAGAQVRAWFATGGGERGNVPAGRVTVMRTSLSGVRVSNPEPATGGQDMEPIEQALRRAPQDFQARDRAVTARDYEVLAARQGGIARVRAVTRRDVWAFASAGQVEVVLVPQVPPSERDAGRVTIKNLTDHSREDVRAQVETYLQQRATIGADPKVRWGRCKQVSVQARVVVRSDEDPDAVRARVAQRLADAINPLAADAGGYGSGFGRALRVSNLYRAMEESEPGVQYVDGVRLTVDQVPDTDAVGLVRAGGQPDTWFVAQKDTLFRTTNAGDGWEACANFPGEEVRAISPYPMPAGGRGSLAHAGMVAVATLAASGSRIYVSAELGETWYPASELGFSVADLTWVERQGRPVLLIAGEKGLYELEMGRKATPIQNVVDTTTPDRGFYSVDAFTDVRGRSAVFVSAEAGAGVWLSADAGAADSFHRIRAAGDEIRCTTVQYDGPNTFLWVGRATPQGNGTGCARLRIEDLSRTDLDSLAGSWEEMATGWSGGTCWGIEVVGGSVYAATQSGGVLKLTLGANPTWDQRDVNCGLPLRAQGRFDPVRSLSGDLDAEGAPVLLAGGERGVFRSNDAATSWSTCTARVVDDVVTVPDTWLFCSGDHDIQVVRANGR